MANPYFFCLGRTAGFAGVRHHMHTNLQSTSPAERHGIRVQPGTDQSMSATPAPVVRVHEPEFLDVAGAAAVLRVSTKSIRRAIERGELAHYRFGRAIRIRRDDLDIWFGAHRVEPFDYRGRMI